MFTPHTFIKLQDVPFVEQAGVYNLFVQIKRLFETFAGRGKDSDRIVTVGDFELRSFFETVNKLPQWDDLRFPVSQLKAGPISPPDWVQLSGLGNIFVLGFSHVTTEDVYFVVQLPHSWVEGSELHPHIHWTSATGNTGNVAWGLEYTIAGYKDSFNTATVDTIVVANPSQYEHSIAAFSPIRMSGKTISSILLCRLYRDSSSVLDTLNEDANLLEIDFHYQKDTWGSLFEYAKR